VVERVRAAACWSGGSLEWAQPVTDALSRGTRALIEPIERRDWGDELLVYARRMI